MKAEKTSPQALSRRQVFAGAGAAGALAAVAVSMHLPQPSDAVVAADSTADEETAGYRLTEHIKRYYQTARV